MPDRDAAEWMTHAAAEFASDSGTSERLKNSTSTTTRIAWLGRLLHELGEEKILLICRSREKALAIEKPWPDRCR